MGLKTASVCACVRASTLSNMNISETSWPIIIKFHQKHHWGWGLTALGFPRLGMSVTTQGGSGRQCVTGSGRNIPKYRFVLLNVYRFWET